jgi:hypothetical protein
MTPMYLNQSFLEQDDFKKDVNSSFTREKLLQDSFQLLCAKTKEERMFII